MTVNGTRWRVVVALLAAAASPLAAQEPVRVTGEGIMLDFQNVDLRLVVAALAEAGELNVVYAELPSRQVTIRTTRPVPRSDMLVLLQSLAKANSLELVEDRGFIRLEPSATGVAEPTDTTPQMPEARQLFVYRLMHARAPRLAATIQTLFGFAKTAAGPATQQRPALSQTLRAQRIAPVQPEADVTATPASTQSPPAVLPADLQGEFQIVPDEATNSLLVRATPTDWQIIEQAIQALDLRPLQVLIEVVIAEVRQTEDLNTGVAVSAFDSRTPGRDLSGELKGPASSDFSLRLTRTGGINLDVALSALAASGRVRILSRPVILAQNNQEARILVGAERPFVQVFRSLPTDAAVRDQVVQYRDVGTSLTITPTVNPDGYVNLQVVQEVSTATNETQFGAPVISTREASTHLLARSGQTVVIGGLVDHQQDWSRSGIPLLKDIPVLGYLFGSTRVTEGTSELFLFLTPHLVATDEDADELRQGIEQNTSLLKKLGPIRSLVPIRPPVVRDTTLTSREG